jgi:hypothetical protein
MITMHIYQNLPREIFNQLSKFSLILIDVSENKNRMSSFEHLSLPRKPAWNRDMTAEEVDENERKVFLTWRRNLSVR